MYGGKTNCKFVKGRPSGEFCTHPDLQIKFVWWNPKTWFHPSCIMRMDVWGERKKCSLQSPYPRPNPPTTRSVK